MQTYEMKVAANATILTFMSGLLSRYSAAEMHAMWQSLTVMIQRYGTLFVADSIKKSDAEAELALARYGRVRRYAV